MIYKGKRADLGVEPPHIELCGVPLTRICFKKNAPWIIARRVELCYGRELKAQKIQGKKGFR